MAPRSGSLLLGEEPRYAARQAAILFVISGLLAGLVGFTGPDRAAGLMWIGLADVLVGCVTWVLPWDRWGPKSPLLLAIPALGLLAVATYGYSGFGSGSGPFFVLCLAWIGLHYSLPVMLAFVPAVAAAYMAPLIMAQREVLGGPPTAVTMGSGVVLVGTGIAIAYMITRQVAYQHEILERVKEMEKWRAALMGALAHDVRLPITSVLFSLEMLEDDWPNLGVEQRKELISAALRQTVRIQRLADGLLDVERLSDEGRLRLDLQDVPLRAAVDAAVEFLSVPGLIVDVDPGLVVRADGERLEQILVNLIGNAVRHGGPPVIVSAMPIVDSVRLEIRDHGDGVPEHLRERLFDRFSASADHAGSVGLGLWITRQLVEAHGGEVRYEPAEPGARFIVTLARAPVATHPEPYPMPGVDSHPPDGRPAAGHPAHAKHTAHFAHNNPKHAGRAEHGESGPAESGDHD